MKKKLNKKVLAAELAVLGASLAGLAATAYFFFGPKGKANQKHAKAWAIKMKADVIGKLEAAKKITEPIYHEIIDAVAKEYAKGKKAGQSEVKALAQDLKKHWNIIGKSAKAVKDEAIKGAVKAAKKARI